MTNIKESNSSKGRVGVMPSQSRPGAPSGCSTDALASAVKEINLLLATDTSNALVRLGIIAASECFLRANGRYCGIRYLYEHEVPPNELPGNSNGMSKEVDATRLAFIV